MYQVSAPQHARGIWIDLGPCGKIVLAGFHGLDGFVDWGHIWLGEDRSLTFRWQRLTEEEGGHGNIYKEPA